jgi:hypothetical protein
MGKENIEKALKKWLSISDMIPFDVIIATALIHTVFSHPRTAWGPPSLP